MVIRKFVIGLTAMAIFYVIALQGGLVHAENALEPGEYTADYVVLKAENDSVSMANDYWEKPANVTIYDHKATIRLTINHSAWVTSFKVPSGSDFAEAKIIETDEEKDTRLVEFDVTDITKPIISKIHVTVADIDYDHDYTIRLSFDIDSFTSVSNELPQNQELEQEATQATEQNQELVQETVQEQASVEVSNAELVENQAPQSDGQNHHRENKTETDSSVELDQTLDADDNTATTASQLQQDATNVEKNQTEVVGSEVAIRDTQTEVLGSAQASTSFQSSKTSGVWWFLSCLLVVLIVAGYFFVKRKRGSYEH